MKKRTHVTFTSYNRKRNKYARGAAYRQDFIRKKRNFLRNCYYDVILSNKYSGFMVSDYSYLINIDNSLLKLECSWLNHKLGTALTAFVKDYINPII